MRLPRNGARLGFQHLLCLGCYSKLIPYNWNRQTKQLVPASDLSLLVFNLHKNITFIYTFFNWYTLVYAYVVRGEFSLLNALWAVSKVTCFSGFLSFAVAKEPLMHLANRLLQGTATKNLSNVSYDCDDSQKQEISSLETETMNHWTFHIFANLFLLYTNPQFHSIIVYQNPCAPNFISAMFFTCTSPFEDPAPLWEKLPFLVFEFYTTAKWQYISSLQLSFVYSGLAQVVMEMNKLSQVTIKSHSRKGEWKEITEKMRRCDLLVNIINHIFFPYLALFPAVGTAVVALLLYGLIHLWRIDPQSTVMFPLCAIRCAFEALSPMAIAGKVHSESESVIENWRKSVDHLRLNNNKGIVMGQGIIRKNNFAFKGTRMKIVKALQRSCKPLRCRSGSTFYFETSMVLEISDNCFQQTVNLLVTFPDL